MINYQAPILVLISLLIVFHLLLIKWLPQGKRFWKRVDYFWVSLSMIGILGATNSVNREYASLSTPWYKQTIDLRYKDLLTKAGKDAEYFKELADDRSYITEKDRQYDKAKVFFIFFDSTVERYEDEILNKQDYQYLDSLDNLLQTFSKDSLNNVVRQSLDTYLVETMKDAAGIIETRERLGDRKGWEFFLFIIFPYLFSIAVAIRITKVTAEIRELP